MRVVLCDDDQMFLEAFAVILIELGWTVGALAVTADEAEEAVLRHRPEVAVLDPDFPGGGGRAVVRSLRTWAPETRLMVLTAAGGPATVGRKLGLADDAGIVLASKWVEIDQIITAMDRMARKKAVLNRDQLLGGSQRARHQSDVEHLLTGREREILARLVHGQSTNKIAADLGITINTARSHLQNVLTKLGVHSRVEAAALAVRSGMHPEADS